MYYQVKVDGSRVSVTLEATTGWTFQFNHETGHESWAQLLAESLRKKRDTAESEEWKRNYNQGWADAKAKRAKATA